MLLSLALRFTLKFYTFRFSLYTKTMLPREVLKKIRRIEITTSKLATDFLSGQYESVFKGRGIEFDEVRDYQPGDEIRTIDWNVTARMGTPFVKKFVEERQLTVMLLLDASRSSITVSCLSSTNFFTKGVPMRAVTFQSMVRISSPGW